MDPPFVAEEARLHVFQVVAFAFLEVRVVPALLHFLGLEVVAGVVFVGDGEGYYVEADEAVDDSSFAAHGKHLQYAVLRAVVGVFGTSLPLGDPDGLLLFVDDVVHVFRQAYAGFEHLAHVEAPLHDECLVDADDVLDPRVDEQVVAYGDLHGVHAFPDEEYGEEAGVEHDVAVVGDVCVAALAVEVGRQPHGELFAVFPFDFGQYLVAEAFLEFVYRAAAAHPFGYLVERHGEDAFHGSAEIFVGYEPLVGFGEFFIAEGAYLVEFRRGVFHFSVYELERYRMADKYMSSAG